jgi:hypothetical protein
MDAPNEIRPGQVEITLSGFNRPLILKPSIEAALAVSRKYGGIREAADRVERFDVEAIIAVIAAGAGLAENGMKKLPGAVFETGIMALGVPVTRFLVALANGGRPARPNEPDEDQDPSLD